MLAKFSKIKYMIFLTVGNNIPFNRLVRTVDDWAASNRRSDVVAQIGINGWCPRWIRYVTKLTPVDFDAYMNQANLVVSHAGIGTILAAQKKGKPLIVMPRSGDLKETRNNHQIATSHQFRNLNNLWVAKNEKELVSHLNRSPYPICNSTLSEYAESGLIEILKHFIQLSLS